MIVEKYNIIPCAIQLIKSFDAALFVNNGDCIPVDVFLKNGVLQTPKWIAPLFLLLDLYEKASTISHRKFLLGKVVMIILCFYSWLVLNSPHL